MSVVENIIGQSGIKSKSDCVDHSESQLDGHERSTDIPHSTWLTKPSTSPSTMINCITTHHNDDDYERDGDDHDFQVEHASIRELSENATSHCFIDHCDAVTNKSSTSEHIASGDGAEPDASSKSLCHSSDGSDQNDDTDISMNEQSGSDDTASEAPTGSDTCNEYQEDNETPSGITMDTDCGIIPVDNVDPVNNSNSTCADPENVIDKENNEELDSDSNLSGGDDSYNEYNVTDPDDKLVHCKFEFVEAPVKLKASVWQYFGFYKNRRSDETHFDRTLCKLCNNLLAYNSGCTTNMRQHLIRSHGVPEKSLMDLQPRLSQESGKITSKNSATLHFEFVAPPPYLKAMVWEHFGYYKDKGSEQTKFDRTWCRLCDRLLLYTGGSTSNMRSHLARHHGIQLDSLNSNSSHSTDTSKANPDWKPKKEVEVTFASQFEMVAPKPRLKALVWQYFGFYKLKGSDETKYDYTCCKLCKTMLKYVGGCTSGMRTHLLRSHEIDLQNISDLPLPAKDVVNQLLTVRDFKKLLRRQSCANVSCNKRIKLEADGSPPQFCSGCGLLLSHSLSELWNAFAQCCKLCGKIKDSSSDSHFCSRCGGYLSNDVEVFSHSTNSDGVDDSLDDKSEIQIPLLQEPDAPSTTTKAECDDDEDYYSSQPYIRRSTLDCRICSFHTTSKRNLKAHYKIVHSHPTLTGGSDVSACKLHECDVCEYKTTDWNSFTDHATVHLTSNTDFGEIIGEGAGSLVANGEQKGERKGRLHDLIEHIKEQKQTKADGDWPLEVDDTLEVLSDDQSSNANPDCNLEQMDIESVKPVRAKSHSRPAKLRPRYCKTCNEEFDSLPLLRQHEQTTTCTATMLTCDECDYMTSKLDGMRGHKRRNHGNIVMKKCNYCDRLFKRQRNLEEHMNTHTGSTPFQCDKCGKAFHTNSSWYKHKRNNCEKGPRDRKLCAHCGKAVINLSKHISDVHFNIKEFHCEICKKSFGTQYHLDRHIRIHTGEKPYPCKYCDYRASQKVVTDGHMKKCKYRPANSSDTVDGADVTGSD